MGSSRSLGCLAVVLGTLATASTARAEKLYGVTGTDGQPSTLYEIDPATGAALKVIGTVASADGGGVGFTVTGMRRHPTTGVMYATTCRRSTTTLTDGGGTGNFLITIDLTTGVGTPVGPTTAVENGPIADISFGPNGKLYGWQEPGTDSIVQIDIATGGTTLVQKSGLDTAGSGFVFGNDGTLYYAGNGPGSNLSILNVTTGFELAAIPFQENDSGGAGEIGSLAVNHAGQLFGVEIQDNRAPNLSSRLVRIDPATDAGTISGDAGDDAGDAGVFAGAYTITTLGVTAYGDDAGIGQVPLSAIAFNVDFDDDGVLDGADNCPDVANPDQKDSDGNGVGDACDPNFKPDSGPSAIDSGAPVGRDASIGSDGGGDGNGDTGSNGGCGCDTVGAGGVNGVPALIVAALAAARVRSRRKRAGKTS